MITIDTTEQSGWKLQPAQLESCLSKLSNKPKMLLLNYHNNPVGNTFNDSELAALADIARRRDVIVLADEIYGELTFGKKHKTIASWYPEGTIISSGLSKWCGAGGWRLGHFVIPKELEPIADAMTDVASETYTSTSTPIQFAAVAAYTPDSGVADYVQNSLILLKHICGFCHRHLIKIKLSCPLPEGGFYCFPNFEHYRNNLMRRGIISSQQLCTTLLSQTGSALLPGIAFGRPAQELTARLSFVDFDGANAHKIIESRGVSQISAADIAPKIVKALNLLEEWLNS